MRPIHRLFRFRSKMSLAAIATITVLLLVAGVFAMNLTSTMPEGIGIHQGKLAGCPETPNCVSTQASSQQHWIEPITFSGNAVDALEHLVDVVAAMPGCTIVTQEDRYVHAEFRSSFFRFVDDVEFLVEPETGRIHFRSASRVGYSDLSANRNRMEAIRSQFETATESEWEQSASRRESIVPPHFAAQ